MTASPDSPAPFHGDDELLFGIILGVLTFWLFAQTTLNIAPAMSADLGVDASIMNIAVAATAPRMTTLLVPRSVSGGWELR